MNSKYYKIADITVEVRSDLPITENTFHPKFKRFESKGPSDDMVVMHHHFDGIPDIPVDKNTSIYMRPPWAIYRDEGKFIYQWITTAPPHSNYCLTAISNEDHSHIEIYHDKEGEQKYTSGELTSLAMFSTDQIWISHLLSNRNGCIIHSLGAVIDGNGFLFVGHSDAGKSTMAKMLMKDATILCDDRNIIRNSSDGYRVFGTWSHGDVSEISPLGAPLNGIYFLKKSTRNEMQRIKDHKDAVKSVLSCLIRPMSTAAWWHRSLALVMDILTATPCWNLEFDKDGGVLDTLRNSASLK